MIVKTETGSTYEIIGHRIRRVNDDYSKRGDGLWLDSLEEVKPVVGYPMLLALEPLGAYGPDDEGNRVADGVTFRRTSRVVEVIVQNTKGQ